jgi:hypothetical protein
MFLHVFLSCKFKFVWKGACNLRGIEHLELESLEESASRDGN